MQKESEQQIKEIQNESRRQIEEIQKESKRQFDRLLRSVLCKKGLLSYATTTHF
jgi:vacuolar-type H+-ATPase subunit E/Vma4